MACPPFGCDSRDIRLYGEPQGMNNQQSRRRWSERGFAAAIYGSITNEINWQIGQLRRQGLEPGLVRLGTEASRVYAREHWAEAGLVRNAPKKHAGYRCSVPIRYRDPRISGVIVEPI